ncbi:MAG: S49 family peptidase [Amaricoccus sp.]|uniref:S49 family peptidase n=1 Tax=Amaricoccus sp. TaxID=1872485 RepID=UPI001DDFB734|nr:S49 family peptidase [Amaricoccus sp.]MCB1371895.1 S49 family peptidase [Paracoccaceae bacterium]HRW16410.1 S49 family peptidase [Amaricoccus sp.]
MHSPLLTRLAGRPLALGTRALDGLLALSPEARGPMLRIGSEDRDTAGYAVTDGGIAVVPVLGPLLTRGDWLTSLLGATDYGALGRTLEAAFSDPSAQAVVLELDSPGGEVGGLFDLVDRIGALRESSGRPLWAVAGEAALSAAYAIASAAERIYVTRTAEIGSIGIVAAHIDTTGADAMAGRKWTLVHAGARKTDGNSHEPLSDRALAAIQTDVDALHAELCALVARNRRLTPETVRATEAAIWRGSRGIAASFADRLGTLDQALADLAASLDPPPGRAARITPTRPMQGTSMTDQTTTASTETPAVADPPASPAASEAPAAPTPADTAAGVAPAAATVAASPIIPAAPVTPAPAEPAGTAARLRAEFAEIASVAAQAGRLGVDIDAADAMVRGVAADALRRSVLETLAARSEAAAVVSAAPTPAAAPIAESPIVRRARERAAAPRS